MPTYAFALFVFRHVGAYGSPDMQSIISDYDESQFKTTAARIC